MSALLTLDAVTAHYGLFQALHGVSLTADPGETIALVGANGAGKTTLMRAICGDLPAGGRIAFRGQDITGRIRTPEISMLASAVSARPVVRSYLLGLQRDLGRQKGAVFEGRDMGTVVFPEADVKFFLDASADIRAARRYEELKRDPGVTLEDVAREMGQRDRNDSSRAVAPLRAAADAIRIDSSRLSIDAVVRRMVDEVKRRACAPNAAN